MSNIPAFLGTLRTAMKAADATFPKPVATAIADQDRLAVAVSALPSSSYTNLMAAVAAALLDGRDPLDDETVRRLATARILEGTSDHQSLAYGVAKAAEQRIVDALTANADAILADLKKAVDAAGERLTAAHEILGDVDLGDTAAVLRGGPTAATAWATAKEAVGTIRTIDAGWFALGHITRHVSPDTATTLRLADVSLDDYEQLGHRADPWDLVRAGATINMATRATVGDRIARHLAERDGREQAAVGVEQDAASRSLRFTR